MAMAPRRPAGPPLVRRPARSNCALSSILLSTLALLSPLPAAPFSASSACHERNAIGHAARPRQRRRGQRQRALRSTTRDHQSLDRLVDGDEVVEVDNDDNRRKHGRRQQQQRGAISMTVDELTDVMGSWGRARIAWDLYRIGVDPALYFGDDGTYNEEQQSTSSTSLDVLLSGVDGYDDPARRSDIINLLPTQRRSQTLGRDALAKLAATYPQSSSSWARRLEGGVASLSHVNRSSDGTTKLLLRLQDGLEVETVIIPWFDKGWSTVCISSQVGCRQGCTFCATGRMGKLRNLSCDEILAQFFFATKLTRLLSSSSSSEHDDDDLPALPELSNVVFMGMGEPTDNADEVNAALRILTDVEHYHMSQTKVTLSTVAPAPDAFDKFADSPCVLAWSVHAANDELRKRLVPTTKHSMEELSRGLVDALLRRPAKLRATMLEVALMAGVNDSIENADELADLALSIMDDVPAIKLVVNLIPFNDIGRTVYGTPRGGAVKAFQDRLWRRGVYAHVRTTRGDDESAACGQLATTRSKRSKKWIESF